MQTIQLGQLARYIGRDRLEAYGVSILGTVFGVVGNGQGTVLKVTPQPALMSLMAACPPCAYPRRLIALLAEIVEALEAQGYHAPPIPSELFALASELLRHKAESSIDLLARARALDSEHGPYVLVPRIPATTPPEVESAVVGRPLVEGDLGEMESRIAEIPGSQWRRDLIAHSVWFDPRRLGDFFGFVVARIMSDDEYDDWDLRDARVSLFGWSPILPEAAMPGDAQIRSLLLRAPTAQLVIP